MKHVFTEDEQHTVLLKSLRERMKPRFIVRLFEGIVRMLAPLM
jgi:hypothetical protein